MEESNAYFRLLVENAQDLVYNFRFLPEPEFVYVSPSAVRLTGYTPEEFYANPDMHTILTHPDYQGIMDTFLKQRQMSFIPMVLRWIRKDKRVIWVELQITPFFDRSGNLLEVICSAHDITDSEQHKFELEALFSIGASMRHAVTRSELLEIILNSCMLMVEAEGAALAVRNQFSGETLIEQGAGILEAAAGLVLPGEANLAALADLKQSIQVESPGLAGGLFSFLAPIEGIKFITISPLISQNELIGVMLLENEREINAGQVRLLKVVNEITANALKRTTSTQQASQYMHQMATAGELGLMLSKAVDLPAIYKSVGHFMKDMLPDVAGLFISLFDPVKELFTCVYAYGDEEEIDPAILPPAPLEPPGMGFQSTATRNRRPVIIADMTQRSKKAQVEVIIGDPSKVTHSGLFVPMLSRGKVIGVVNVQSYVVNRFSKQDVEVMTLVSNTTAVAIENARLIQGLQATNRDLVEAYDATIAGWTYALDYRDHETEGHSQRVAEMTIQLAREMGMEEGRIIHIQRGALLHDIGKIGIPDAILNKPGPLTAEEWEIMRRHPQIAFDLLSKIKYLDPAVEIPLCHHEKWDGSGYPRRLKGEEIPIEARLFAIVDVWDALRSDRPYRKAWPREKVEEYIRSLSGTHFDPRVVDVFLKG